MTTVILDASVALSWIVPEQMTKESERLLNDARVTDFEAPAPFPLEVRNALLKLERRGFCTPGLTRQGLAQLRRLPLLVHEALNEDEYEAAMVLARKERLSFYDSTYLALALKRAGAKLASRDGSLLDAAARRGVPLVDARA